MRQFRTSLALPAVAAGIATLAGTAIAVGIITNPTATTDPPTGPGSGGIRTSHARDVNAPSGKPHHHVRAGRAGSDQRSGDSELRVLPAIVTVKVGTTVTWTNRDQDAHTATAMSGGFHSPTLNTGQSYQYTFTTPGRFEYLCTIHPFMRPPWW
jgi:plastocyanin